MGRVRPYLTHTALLVRSVDRAAEFFAKRGFYIHSPKVFEYEGSREIYVGNVKKQSSRILLVEPNGEGPYWRALRKRDEGIHHLGIEVENLVGYCTKLGRVGWLLHVHSLVSAPSLRVAYLVRPGVPLMLEVRQVRAAKKRLPSLLKRVSIPIASKYRLMIEAIGLTNVELVPARGRRIDFHASSIRFSMKELLRSDR